jgi:ABC-type transport system involved in cytochrome bd biosynthesis fused ATPase/permease subunit
VLSSLSLAVYWLPSKLEARYEQKVLKTIGSFKVISVTLSSATHVYVAIWLVLMPLWLLVFWLLSLRLADTMARMRRHGLARLMERHTTLVGALPDISLYQATQQLPQRVREIPTDLRAELKMISSELLEASTTLSRL